MQRFSRSLKGAVKAFGLATGAFLCGYWMLFAFFVITGPLPYYELDFNHDRTVSFSEADYAAAYGTRLVAVDGNQCVEYFAYKDGLPLKVACSSPV